MNRLVYATDHQNFYLATFKTLRHLYVFKANYKQESSYQADKSQSKDFVFHVEWSVKNLLRDSSKSKKYAIKSLGSEVCI